MNTSRSPISWIGGKHYSAKHIIKQFPAPSAYDSYVELFGGAAHVLMQKKPYKHIECYNDLNGNLVNFWIQCKENANVLEEKCRMLPYSRDLYYSYHRSLWDGSELEPLERAVRWFYVLRSSFSAHDRDTPSGWSAGTKDTTNCSAHAYHSAVDLFGQVSRRFRNVMIDNRDFEKVLKQYEKPRTLYYIDPPYVDTEFYYSQAFTMEDHERLASLLNSTSAYVALSYYPHQVLDELYPADKWRRVTWEMPKHAQRTKDKHDYGQELLLLNYQAQEQSLWDYTEAAI